MSGVGLICYLFLLILYVQSPAMVAHEHRVPECPGEKRIENSIVVYEPGASRDGLPDFVGRDDLSEQAKNGHKTLEICFIVTIQEIEEIAFSQHAILIRG